MPKNRRTALHEGLFLVDSSGNGVDERCNCKLYSDRLECWKAGGAEDLFVIFWTEDIEDLEILDKEGFLMYISDRSKPVRLTLEPSAPADTAESWVSAFGQMLNGETQPSDSQDQLNEPQDSSAQGPRLVELLQAKSAPGTPSSLNSQPGLASLRSQLTSPELTKELTNPLLTDWLASLKERPIIHGLLGMQHSGRMAPMFSILFTDRIDCYLRPMGAARGLKPHQRISLDSVYGVEMICNGFILNCGSRKVGVHVGKKEDLMQWSSSLKSLLSERPDSDDDSKSPPRKPVAKPKTVTADPDFLPRVATLPPKNVGSPISEQSERSPVQPVQQRGRHLYISTAASLSGAGDIASKITEQSRQSRPSQSREGTENQPRPSVDTSHGVDSHGAHAAGLSSRN